MKKFKVILILLSVCILWSCDANKGKVEESAKLFIDAINSKDKAALFDVFPSLKDYKNLTPSDSIKLEDISVNFNEKDSVYEAIINEAKNQKVICKVSEDGTITVEDTYNIMILDSASTELAIKTGVPLKKISDVEKSKLLDPDKEFINYLGEQYPSAIGGNLVRESSYHSWGARFGSYYCDIHATIRNTGNTTVSGEDCAVECSITTGNNIKTTRTAQFYNLAPGESTDLTFNTEFYNWAVKHELWYSFRIVFKDLSPVQLLLKYAEFKGTEFDDFINKQEKASSKEGKEAQEKLFDLASSQELTEEDIEGLSKSELRVLRNSIYARHGYTFKDKNLTDIFSQYSWYKATSADMEAIASQMSDVEKNNVDFIQKHE